MFWDIHKNIYPLIPYLTLSKFENIPSQSCLSLPSCHRKDFSSTTSIPLSPIMGHIHSKWITPQVASYDKLGSGGPILPTPGPHGEWHKWGNLYTAWSCPHNMVNHFIHIQQPSLKKEKNNEGKYDLETEVQNHRHQD